jgi:hypothetical protein
MKFKHCPVAVIRMFFILSVILFFSSCEKKDDHVSLADYQRAEKFLRVNTVSFVPGLVSSPVWLQNDVLIYKNSVGEGSEYIFADPTTKKRERAFDHEKLAASLSKVTGKEVKPFELTLTQIDRSTDVKSVMYTMERKRYRTDLTSYETTSVKSSPNEHLSPDGLKAAYIKDFNLWVRNTETDQRTQLTFDGRKDYGYATDNAGWTKSESPVLLWSPQSDKIATFQHDGRGVGEMYLYTTKVGHSKLEAWKYPLPGDSLIFRIERVVVHLEKNPKVVRLKTPPDPHRSTISDHIANRDKEFLDVEWSADGKELAFVSSSRDHKIAELKVADPTTGVVRSVLTESVKTYFESGEDLVNWHVLNGSNEVMWFSERDNWGHLYLYDLAKGDVKNQITKGEWRVLQVLHIDEQNRVIYFTGSNTRRR